MAAKKILIVEDEMIIAQNLKNNLIRLGYEVPAIVGTGEEAINVTEWLLPDLILMDIMLKGNQTGIETAEIIRGLYNIPIIYLTAYPDERTLSLAKVTLPFGYLVKPVEIQTLHSTIEMALYKHGIEQELKRYQEKLEEMVKERTQDLEFANKALRWDIQVRKEAEAANKEKIRELLDSIQGLGRLLAQNGEALEIYAPGHSRRVGLLAASIGREAGLLSEECKGLFLMGVLHDIGKTKVPRSLLTKTEVLTEEEFERIKTHAQIGFELTQDLISPWPISKVILQHHEKMDGSGYPRGLTGAELLLEAKVLMVAEVVEGIASPQLYRPGLGTEAALEEISTNDGLLYDREVVQICLKLFREKGFRLE
jgi:HD-GYP domain-containing protein (c-di-GMP phosphodiesterase class II)